MQTYGKFLRNPHKSVSEFKSFLNFAFPRVHFREVAIGLELLSVRGVQ